MLNPPKRDPVRVIRERDGMTDERNEHVYDYQAEEKSFTLDAPSLRVRDRMSDLFGTLQRDSRIDDPPPRDQEEEFKLWMKRELT